MRFTTLVAAQLVLLSTAMVRAEDDNDNNPLGGIGNVINFGKSVFNEVTSNGADAFNDVTSAFGNGGKSILSDVTALGGSIASDVTGAAGNKNSKSSKRGDNDDKDSEGAANSLSANGLLFAAISGASICYSLL
ncbi:hypothetical protein H4219_003283 [Mycoemilia scoparia]|uniref:Uncharacterized protein n=1 Tax=Mycoemilia scoparia TaxID=417184 RepID=A0A9W8A1R6_9FUNG|nr:hypothetical protein H4219_003283 [Mycoemilia scoparia]